jgi:hypothetical protein
MVIRSHEKHHAIIDTEGEILEYRYRIKPDLLKTLEETTEALPTAKVNAYNRGDYPTHHYTVWCDYSKVPFESAEYQKELPASREWCDKNKELFEYLSEGLQIISPMTYVRYRGTQPYLQDLDLKPLWQLEMIVELEPGDAFFFMGLLIAHNFGETQGVQNSIDLFCHNNVLSWKDKCDEERQGGKLNE